MKSRGLLVVIIVVTFGYTQAPDILWTKTYGGTGNDVGNSIKQTLDGGYIIAGYTESFGAGQQDVWLLKTDANGDTVWTKTYGGVYNDWAECVQQTNDGGYIIAANLGALGWGGTWLIKTDSIGGITWTQIYGGWCHEVQQTSDGGYVTVKNYWGPGGYHGFLLKTDASGDTIWTSDDLHAYGFSVRQTFDGGYIVAGEEYIGQGTSGPWLAKLDTLGDTIWCRTLLFSSPPAQNTRFLSVKQTLDSGYVACGLRIWADYSCVLCIIKTDHQGDTLWTRQYGDSLALFEWFANSVQLTNDNGYILTGGRDTLWTQVGDLVLLKIDENGDTLWFMVCSGVSDEEGHEVQQTNDGGYIVVGSTESYGAGGKDVWIIKTEPDVGIEEQPLVKPMEIQESITTTIFRGPIQLPEGKECKVFDITGRVVQPDKIQPGIYFIEIDGVVTQKVVKVR
jgi:hypothetical protein